jgi:hypothetical protein
MFAPGHATKFELKIVGSKRAAEIAAIIFHGVGGFVATAEQGDDALCGHFSTR